MCAHAHFITALPTIGEPPFLACVVAQVRRFLRSVAPLFILFLFACFALGCATIPNGWDSADSGVVLKNVEIAKASPACQVLGVVGKEAYKSSGGTKDDRILRACDSIRDAGGLDTGRRTGLSGSDAEVLLGILVAGTGVSGASGE